jgi:hypothetical protein
VRTFTWSPWDGGGLPPWMDIQDQPWFDECKAADRLQDLEWAAQAHAERFGPPADLAAEAERRPRPRWLAIAPPEVHAALSDDDITIARRRRILNNALDPDRIRLPARGRGRRTA